MEEQGQESAPQIVLTDHVIERMLDRGITRQQLELVLTFGSRLWNKKYPDATTYVLNDESHTKGRLYVAVKTEVNDEGKHQVITAYWDTSDNPQKVPNSRKKGSKEEDERIEHSEEVLNRRHKAHSRRDGYEKEKARVRTIRGPVRGNE